jgi:hypothetical protein
MINSSDVNQSQNLSAFDSYLVLKALNEASFRFPVQSGTSFNLAATPVQASQNTYLNISVLQPATQKSYQLELPLGMNIYGIELVDYTASIYCLSAYNEEGRLAIASYNPFPSSLRISGLFPVTAYECNIENNGNAGILSVVQGSPNGDEQFGIPVYALLPNYPNPFNPTTTIKFSLPEAAHTSLAIYNTKGQKIHTIVNGELSAGSHSFVWNALDIHANPVSAGIYFYRLSSSTGTITRKMVLSK